MSYGKKRLRSMGPEQRLQARLANELQSVLTRWKNSIERMGEIELDARALANGHKLHGPDVRIVAGKVEDYWPMPLCVNCQTPIGEGRWSHAEYRKETA
jgi:hypothetical protein